MKRSKRFLLVIGPSLLAVFACRPARADSDSAGLPQQPPQAESCSASQADADAISGAQREKNTQIELSEEATLADKNDLYQSSQDLMSKPDSFWRDRLDADVFYVTRNGGTEPPGTGIYNHFKEHGIYKCSNCGQPLFKSETKYDSGSGWPSFYEAFVPNAVVLKADDSHGMHRIEVLCAKCGAHLGHVFEDGPAPTGQRFCINSLSLQHEKTPLPDSAKTK